MYEELFKSAARPFRATPDAKFYFPHDNIESARQTIVRAIERAEGPVMVLGGAGLGKSLLSVIVADDVSEKFDVVKLHAARLCSRRALLQNILFELQLPYRDLSEGELRLSILDRLAPQPDTAPNGILILVDEAHTLPTKLLEELRLLTNFTRDAQPRARLVLFGSMRLEDMFASPQMESFNQRLAARCYLTPMNRGQTHRFVEHQISAAGFEPNEFITSEGLDAVYAASEGVPRLANQIMDHALVLAITNHQCPVSAALVEEAWADLQQLPVPWQSTAAPHDAVQASAVEFGTLDDEEAAVDSSTSDAVLLAAPADNLQDPAMDSDHQSTPEYGVLEFESVQPSDGGKLSQFAPTDEVQPHASDGLSEDGGEPVYESCEDALETEVSSDVLPLDEEAADSQAAETNFFAAFTEPQLDEFEIPVAEQQDPNSPQDTSAASADIDRPQVVFDASQAFNQVQLNLESDAVGVGEPLPPDSFFANRPTDEKMIALADEQDQYDAMGVWENDPPLPNEDNELLPQDASCDGTPCDQPQCQDSDRNETRSQEATVAEATEEILASNPSMLFGSDFDIEESIDVSPAGFGGRNEPRDENQLIDEQREALDSEPSQGPALNSAPPHSSTEQHNSTDRPTADPDSPPTTHGSNVATRVAALEMETDRMDSNHCESSDSPSCVNESAPSPVVSAEYPTPGDSPIVSGIPASTIDLVGESADSISELANEHPGSSEAEVAPWSVDVSSLDVSHEIEVQNEIEDIVSQLNFSAFAVEPYSVEQIQLEPSANAEIPNDSIRTGSEDEIYMMHRPLNAAQSEQPAANIFAVETQQFDDDRDLLIIEEEMTKNSTASAASEQPVTKTKPYSQLFAKLRK